VKNGVRVQGSEFITYLKEYNGEERLRLITANPITWLDTRVQREARLYSLYKPLALSLSYIPTVGTATDGNLVMGMLPVGVNPGTSSTHWIRQLVASGQSIVSAPYYPATVKFDCSGWEQPRFKLGQITEEGTNPFYMAAHFTNSDADVTCGMLIVTYDFIFTKPSNPEYLPYETVQYDPTAITVADSIEGNTRTLGTTMLIEQYVDLGDAKLVPGDIMITTVKEAASCRWNIIRDGQIMLEVDDLDGTFDGVYMKPPDQM
jgi:hypothetical protein